MTKREAIIEEVKKAQPFTNVGLSEKLGFNFHTVRGCVLDLLNSGEVMEVGRGKSNGNKPRVIYRYVTEPIVFTQPPPPPPTQDLAPEEDEEDEAADLIGDVAQKISDLRIAVEEEKMSKARIIAEIKREHDSVVSGLRQRLNALHDTCISQKEEISSLVAELSLRSKELLTLKDAVDGYRKLDSLIKGINRS